MVVTTEILTLDPEAFEVYFSWVNNDLWPSADYGIDVWNNLLVSDKEPLSMERVLYD